MRDRAPHTRQGNDVERECANETQLIYTLVVFFGRSISQAAGASLDDKSQSLVTLAVETVSSEALLLSDNMASMAAASCRSIKELEEILDRREFDGVLSLSTTTGIHGSLE